VDVYNSIQDIGEILDMTNQDIEGVGELLEAALSNYDDIKNTNIVFFT